MHAIGWQHIKNKRQEDSQTRIQIILYKDIIPVENDFCIQTIIQRLVFLAQYHIRFQLVLVVHSYTR